MSFRILINVFAHHMEESKWNTSGQQWHDGILLKLIIENWSITCTFWTNCKSLLSISDCDVKTTSSWTHAHRCDTNSSGKKLLCDGKESLWKFLDSRIELTLFIYISELIEHVDSWDSDIFKKEGSIINSILSHFNTHIDNGYSWNFFHVFVSNSNQEWRNSFVLSINNTLSEENGVIRMLEAISNPVFLT